MLLTILSMIVNVAYLVILNIAFYTDRAVMPTGASGNGTAAPLQDCRLPISRSCFICRSFLPQSASFPAFFCCSAFAEAT